MTAEQVTVRRMDDAEEPYMEISGVLRQATIFGESFHVTRTIRCYLRRNCIELHDVIENRAFEAQPLMVAQKLSRISPPNL